jgi:hypothetical protein
LSLWRVEWRLYSLLDDKLWDLGRQLPEYYGDEDPSELGFQTKQRLKAEAWEKFLNMDMFFVKVNINDMQKYFKANMIIGVGSNVYCPQHTTSSSYSSRG